MLNKVKRHWLLLCGVLVALAISIQRVAYYYVNGQAIASRHTDGYYGAFAVNLFYAIALIVILIGTLTVIFIIKKNIKNKLEWFLIPAILGAFAPIHLYIGSLFLCCPVGDGIPHCYA